MTDTTFTDNLAHGSGGGAYIFDGSALVGGAFQTNQGIYDAGGLYIGNQYSILRLCPALSSSPTSQVMMAAAWTQSMMFRSPTPLLRIT